MQKFLIALIGTVFLFQACTNDDGHDNKNKVSKNEFTSDSLHFSITPLLNWLVKVKENKVGILENYTNSKDSFQENIVVWTEEMPIAISDTLYNKATITELKIKNPNIEIATLPMKKLGNINFGRFAFTIFLNDSIPCKVLGYTAVQGKRGYNFSCSYLVNGNTNYTSSFENMLSTVKLIP